MYFSCICMREPKVGRSECCGPRAQREILGIGVKTNKLRSQLSSYLNYNMLSQWQRSIALIMCFVL